jgi:predicted DNA-binding transcriptional regulator AlpA
MSTALSQLSDDALLTRSQVRPLAGSPSDDTLTRWAAAGQFPQAIHGPGRRVYYRAGEVRRWLANPAAFTNTAESLV